ncbi:MAG: hypothetical protein QM704_05035 [Anaeromyxobacteraceae bacterium]
MRFLTYVLLVATWLFASAFFLPQTALSAALTVATALALLVLALAAPGKPALRFVVTAIALAMPFTALFLPDLGPGTRLDLLLVAPVLFVLSMVKPIHHRPVRRTPAHLDLPAGHAHGTLDEEILARPT